MKRLEFDCIFDLADTITSLLGDINNDYPVISVYGKYNVIKELLEDLIMNGISIANEIELQDYDVTHYDKEFVLYITLNGINVEKTYHDGTYYDNGGDISYVHEDCSSKLLKHIESETVYEFGTTDDEYTRGIDCCSCTDEDCPNKCLKNANKSKKTDEKYKKYSKDKDEDIHGFTASKSDDNGYMSYSYYTSEKLDNDDINKMLKIFGF